MRIKLDTEEEESKEKAGESRKFFKGSSAKEIIMDAKLK